SKRKDWHVRGNGVLGTEGNRVACGDQSKSMRWKRCSRRKIKGNSVYAPKVGRITRVEKAKWRICYVQNFNVFVVVGQRMVMNLVDDSRSNTGSCIRRPW